MPSMDPKQRKRGLVSSGLGVQGFGFEVQGSRFRELDNAVRTELDLRVVRMGSPEVLQLCSPHSLHFLFYVNTPNPKS